MHWSRGWGRRSRQRRAGRVHSHILQRHSPRQLLEPTLVLAILSGFVYLIGYFERLAYFQRMGLPEHELLYPDPSYLIRGVVALLDFLMWLVGIVVVWTGVWLLRRRSKASPRIDELPIFHLAALASIAAAVQQIMVVNDEPYIVEIAQFHASAHQLRLLVIAIAGFVAVGIASFRPGFMPVLLDNTISARAYLGVLIFAALVWTAIVAGSQEANDILYRESSWTEVTLHLDGGGPASYLYVAHAGGHYYVRHLGDYGHDCDRALAISDTRVSSATFVKREPGQSIRVEKLDCPTG